MNRLISAAVVLFFVPLVMFAGEGRHADGAYSYPRFDLFRVGNVRALLNAGPIMVGLRVVSVGLFCWWCSPVCSGAGRLQCGDGVRMGDLVGRSRLFRRLRW